MNNLIKLLALSFCVVILVGCTSSSEKLIMAKLSGQTKLIKAIKQKNHAKTLRFAEKLILIEKRIESLDRYEQQELNEQFKTQLQEIQKVLNHVSRNRTLDQIFDDAMIQLHDLEVAMD